MKEVISLEELASILVDLKFENDQITKKFDSLLEWVEPKKKQSPKLFLEYLVFELFTDNACFLLAFNRNTSLALFEIYSMNILVKLLNKGYKDKDLKRFDKLFKKRFLEYHPYLEEYDSKYIKKIDPNSYLSGLGKIFSMNLVGYKDPAIIDMVHRMFLIKLKHYYGKFLKKLAQEYEVVQFRL